MKFGPGDRRKPLLTKDIFFGMNLLTLVGFVVMGSALTLQRTGTVRTPLSIGLMGVGTVLVILGLIASGSPD